MSRLFLFLYVIFTRMKRKIIIDTDPGVDDGMAIQFALAAEELDVLALTTVFGNASIELTTANALRILDFAGRTDIPVAAGAGTPLKGVFTGGVPHVHGEDGQGNLFRPNSPRTVVPIPADEFLVEQINAQPGELTLVAIGPLTNLARALRLDPTIADKVVEVVVMGGNAFCSGNATPAAEANVLSDPDAADLVLGTNWPVTVIGLDVTHRVNMTGAVLSRLAGLPGRFNSFISTTIPFYQQFYERVNRIDGIYVHDATVIAYLLAPNLFDFGLYPVRVDTSHGIGRGKTWPSLADSDQEGTEALQPWQHRPRVKVGLDVRGDAVIELIVNTLTKAAFD